MRDGRACVRRNYSAAGRSLQRRVPWFWICTLCIQQQARKEPLKTWNRSWASLPSKLHHKTVYRSYCMGPKRCLFSVPPFKCILQDWWSRMDRFLFGVATANVNPCLNRPIYFHLQVESFPFPVIQTMRKLSDRVLKWSQSSQMVLSRQRYIRLTLIQPLCRFLPTPSLN